MTGETALPRLLRAMQPELQAGEFVFCTVSPTQLDGSIDPMGLFHEAEGVTLILSRQQADQTRLPYSYPCRLITLKVHSSLAAVGFLATLTQALAALGISVNPVSAYYHDHLFVPADRAEEALACLVQLVHSHRYDFQTLTIADGDLVWRMLMHAAHEPSLEAVKDQPALARYAAGWGRAGDMGVVALLEDQPLGAAWLRLWPGPNRGFGFVAEGIPELAIAVLPDYQNQGIGSQLLTQLLHQASAWYEAVSLNVRADNPAVRLYQRLGFVKVEGSDVINRAGGVSFNMIRRFEGLPQEPVQASDPRSPLPITVRVMQAADLPAMRSLFSDTIRQVNCQDYSPEQVEVWSASAENEDFWTSRLEKSHVLVAEQQGVVVGFTNLEADGHVDLFYVHHGCQGQGVGTRLMETLAVLAHTQRLSRLYAEVSITAKPFFLRQGFQVIQAEQVERAGVEFTRFVMEKLL